MIRTNHIFRLCANNQPSGWDTNVRYAYDMTWQGWWYLDTSNLAIWWNGGFTGNTYSYWEGQETVQRAHTAVFGETTVYQFPADQLAEADWIIDGPTLADPTFGNTQFTAYVNSCVPVSGATQSFSESQTFEHELGHGYGYWHFDSWISTMNTSQTDVLSCEQGTSPDGVRSMWITPDAQPTQCHQIVYGIGTGRDLSVTPVFQPSGCNLAGAACSLMPGGGAGLPTVFTTQTLAIATASYTQLNNRDGFTTNTVVGFYMSRDSVLDAGDVRIGGSGYSNGNLAGEVRGRTASYLFNPQSALPVTGALYHIIVRVDDTNVITETRETNNVTDTRFFFRRD